MLKGTMHTHGMRERKKPSKDHSDMERKYTKPLHRQNAQDRAKLGNKLKVLCFEEAIYIPNLFKIATTTEWV